MLSSVKSLFSKSSAIIPIPGALTKGGRGQIPRGALSGMVVRNGLLEPLVSPNDLWRAYVNSWMIQAAVDKKVSEALKEVGPIDELFQPKFEKRCDVCDINYQEEPEDGVCEECLGEVRDPDRSQLRRVKEVLEHPTSDDHGFVDKTFKDLIREAMTYEETIGDAYWEVLPSLDGQPAEFWPLTSEFIRKVDEGKEIRFCPYCFTKGNLERLRYSGGGIQYRRLPPGMYANDDGRTHCPVHPDIELKVARWVQVDDLTNITALWADDEILQFGTRQFGTRPYSVPKMYSVWYIAQTLRYQELYQASSYAMNRMPQGALTFPGMSQERVEQTFEEVAEWKSSRPHVPKYLILGAQEPPVWVDFTMKFADLEAKEMALFYREAIAIVWGVSLQMLGIQTPGKLGKETEVAEVSYDAIDELDSQFDEFMNTKVVPRFSTKPLEGGLSEPVVTDWLFELPSSKRDDLMRKSQLVSANVDIIQKLQALGVNARPNKDMTEVKADWSTYDPEAQRMEEAERQRQEMETRFGGSPSGQMEGKTSIEDRLRNMKPGETIEIPEPEQETKALAYEPIRSLVDYVDRVRGRELDTGDLRQPKPASPKPEVEYGMKVREGRITDRTATPEPLIDDGIGGVPSVPPPSKVLVPGESIEVIPQEAGPPETAHPQASVPPSHFCVRCDRLIIFIPEEGRWAHVEESPDTHVPSPNVPGARERQ